MNSRTKTAFLIFLVFVTASLSIIVTVQQEAAADIIVTYDLFSGRPNPAFNLDPAVEKELNDLLTQTSTPGHVSFFSCKGVRCCLNDKDKSDDLIGSSKADCLNGKGEMINYLALKAMTN